MLGDALKDFKKLGNYHPLVLAVNRKKDESIVTLPYFISDYCNFAFNLMQIPSFQLTILH